MVDNIPPEIAIPLAVILWLAVAIVYRRDVIKRRKAERERNRP
jgi:hypothetical protein